MKLKLNKESWANIVNEVEIMQGLIKNGYVAEDESLEYLSDEAIEINFNKMTMVKD
jgi:hypothetical protein